MYNFYECVPRKPHDCAQRAIGLALDLSYDTVDNIINDLQPVYYIGTTHNTVDAIMGDEWLRMKVPGRYTRLPDLYERLGERFEFLAFNVDHVYYVGFDTYYDTSDHAESPIEFITIRESKYDTVFDLLYPYVALGEGVA